LQQARLSTQLKIGLWFLSLSLSLASTLSFSLSLCGSTNGFGCGKNYSDDNNKLESTHYRLSSSKATRSLFAERGYFLEIVVKIVEKIEQMLQWMKRKFGKSRCDAITTVSCLWSD